MRKLILGITLAAAVAAPVALAASSAKFWQNHARTAVCGKRTPSDFFQLLCSAKGIPRPKGGGQGGDPFVALGRTGKAKLVLLSQDEFPAGNPKTLGNGTTWSMDGVSCTVAGKVTCKNTVGHGFTIGNGKYKSF